LCGDTLGATDALPGCALQRPDDAEVRTLSTSPHSVRGELVGGAYGGDDIVSCLAGCGGVRFVVDKRCVGGVNVTVETVGRQCRQVVLLRLPFVVVPLSAVTTMSGLPLRSVRDAACCIDADPSTASSMKLPRWRAVEALARASSR
jgi:hypothetical protein